ncbi:MAG: cyclic 2,3-diphosphoglycerate synthase [Planctomycetota bacterium]
MKNNSIRRTIIMGAGGRDFHNFNLVYRDNPRYKVVAFTATQIPGIENRRYPPALAGRLYPKGIPIYPESKLEELIVKNKVDEVVFSYSDVSFQYVMAIASRVIRAGADFKLLGFEKTALKSKKPVIAIVAIRTGCGKSTVSRHIAKILNKLGIKVGVIRHPMPYGNLKKQEVQKFVTISDLERYECSIEEIEEYEPHIQEGHTVYAGVDYKKVLSLAEKENDLILWDGGNNDLPFLKPDFVIVIADALRPGNEITYYPGATNLLIADVVIINKVNTANPEDTKTVEENIKKINSVARIIKINSEVDVLDVANPLDYIKDKKVLAVEDGPTVTHGEMKFGAATVVAKKYQAREIVDPKPFAVGEVKKAFEKYPHLQNTLPTVGYSKKQIKDLELTINKTDADTVIVGTPINLNRILNVSKPVIRVNYTVKELGAPTIEEIIQMFLRKQKIQFSKTRVASSNAQVRT